MGESRDRLRTEYSKTIGYSGTHMEYHEAADFLFDLRRFRPKPGTESTARLLAHLEDPHETVDFVQIAGSNGKGEHGSNARAGLREGGGPPVGLYTSPHLEDLRERVRVDGRKIPQSATFASTSRRFTSTPPNEPPTASPHLLRGDDRDGAVALWPAKTSISPSSRSASAASTTPPASSIPSRVRSRA